MPMQKHTAEHPLRVAVLISGNGSNLQAIIDANDDHSLAEVRVVVSNRADAYGLERAKQAGISTEVLLPTDFTDRAAYDQALTDCLRKYQPDLILLAGFMWVLGKEFVQTFKPRIINIHPSLLPKYAGMHTHQRVLEAGDEKHGVTVHLVNEELDGGPIIAQESIDVSKEDDIHSLQHKIHALEHRLYPEIIKLYAEGRLHFSDNEIFMDGEPLPPEGLALRTHY